jgi:hypothetical protein
MMTRATQIVGACLCIVSLGLVVAVSTRITREPVRRPPASPSPEKAPDPPALTAREGNLIRGKVYKEGLATFMEISGRWATHRLLYVPPELQATHKQKRVATLRLLLEITRGGRPEDALAAVAYAVALEEDPVVAVGYVDYPLAWIDTELSEKELVGRQMLIDEIERLLSSAETKRHSGASSSR